MPYKDIEKRREAKRKSDGRNPDRVKAYSKRYRASRLAATAEERGQRKLERHLAYKSRQKLQNKANRKRRARENAAYVDAYKSSHPCACGMSHIACLDFHHRISDEKDRDVCEMVAAGMGMSRLKAEIEKCDVLCANCHRKLHWDERQVSSSDEDTKD